MPNKPNSKFLTVALLAYTTTALTLFASAPAHAIDTANPDWPCVQRKILTLTPTQIWDGPDIKEGMPWRNSDTIRSLTRILLSRRVPLEEAEKEIEKFAGAFPKADRDEQLTLLFAAYLERTNIHRKQIVSGIERFQRRQEARSKELENQGEALTKLKARAEKDEKLTKELADATNAYDWDARIFKQRQQNIPLACEIPVLVEQRAFAIARAIRKHMTN